MGKAATSKWAQVYFHQIIHGVIKSKYRSGSGKTYYRLVWSMGCERIMKSREAASGCGTVGCVRQEEGDKGTRFGGEDGVDVELGLGAAGCVVRSSVHRARTEESSGATARTTSERVRQG